ncbi:hypothetical protein H0178_34195 [Cytobacillus firmus]|nr:hypothetical protein [Cytobacillus firmus]
MKGIWPTSQPSMPRTTHRAHWQQCARCTKTITSGSFHADERANGE